MLRAMKSDSIFRQHLYVLALCLAPALAVSTALASCSSMPDCKAPANATSAECSIINALIDCTSADANPAAVQQVEADIAAKNWADLELLAVKYGACVVAEAFSGHFDPQKKLPAELETQYAVLRNKIWPGKGVKTKGGTL